MVKSLEKGKRFEREIADFLTKITNVKWNRVPMSGAYSTKKHIKDNRFKGDVFTENKKFKNVVVECKNMSNNDISIVDLFSFKTRFWKYIKQVEEEAGDYGWILFIKLKKGKVLFVYDERIYNKHEDVEELINLVEEKTKNNDLLVNLFLYKDDMLSYSNYHIDLIDIKR